MPGQATVAIDGLTHPHSEMYLETLEALDEVGGVVLIDPDDAARHAGREPDDEGARQLREPRGGAGAARPDARARRATERPHSGRAGARDRAPGKGVFTEKPGARSAAEFEPVLAALERRPVPFTIAYLNRWSPPIRQVRELYRAGAIGRLTSVELRMVTTQVGMRNPAPGCFSARSWAEACWPGWAATGWTRCAS